MTITFDGMAPTKLPARFKVMAERYPHPSSDDPIGEQWKARDRDQDLRNETRARAYAAWRKVYRGA